MCVSEDRKNGPVESGSDAEKALRQALGMQPLRAGEELIDDDTFSEIHTGARSPLAGLPETPKQTVDADEILLEEVVTELPPRPGPSAPWLPDPKPDVADVVTLEAELARAINRDEVARLTLRIARVYCRAAGLLVVHGATIAGLRGDGEGIGSCLDGILIAADARTLFSIPLKRQRPLRGPAPSLGYDARLLRAMGRAEAIETLIVPIRIRQRVVNLLYTDNGPEPMPDTSAGALVALGGLLSRAYERLILERKQAESAPR